MLRIGDVESVRLAQQAGQHNALCRVVTRWPKLGVEPVHVGCDGGPGTSRLAGGYAEIETWIVEGYREWRGRGLNEPEPVTSATNGYRIESDVLGRFLDERCFVGPHFTVRSSERRNRHYYSRSPLTVSSGDRKGGPAILSNRSAIYCNDLIRSALASSTAASNCSRSIAVGVRCLW